MQGRDEKCTRGFGGKPEGQIKLEAIDVDGRIIQVLKHLLKKWDWRAWVWPRTWHNCGLL
jgi:hypothetical protein